MAQHQCAQTILPRMHSLRWVTLGVAAVVLWTAASFAGATPATPADSEITRRNGIVDCTDELIDRHDPAIATQWDARVCFDAYLSNFDTSQKLPVMAVDISSIGKTPSRRLFRSSHLTHTGAWARCVYLLRSAHKHIYGRSFDMHRTPEYFNRIFLGAIGGRTIILFIDQEVQQGIRLSATALGFLAGYSMDFLFSTIERVISALLPKVGIDTVRRSKAMPPVTVGPIEVGVSVKDLLDRHDKATSDEDRIFYRTLIERLSQNMPP